MSYDDTELDNFLEAEMHIDVLGIREYCVVRGVPPTRRAMIWKLFLHRKEWEKDTQRRVRRQQEKYYEEARKVIHEIKSPNFIMDCVMTQFAKEYPEVYYSEQRERIKNVLELWTAHREDTLLRNSSPYVKTMIFQTSLIHLIMPFVSLYTTEYDLFFCFTAFMVHMDKLFYSDVLLQEAMCKFRTLLAQKLPILREYFEYKEVNLNKWLPLWFTTLGGKILEADALVQLWDRYFTTKEGLVFHYYICVAILDKLKERIMLDTLPNIYSLLQVRLTGLNVEQLIADATNMKNDGNSWENLTRSRTKEMENNPLTNPLSGIPDADSIAVVVM